LAATLAWLWEGEPKPHAVQVPVGRDVVLPVGARGRRSHSWWATWVLVAVDATIALSLLFAHLHVSMRAQVCPPPGASLPAWQGVLIGVLLWAVGSAAIALAQRSRLAPTRRSRWTLTLQLAFAMSAVIAAFGAIALGHAGLQPRAQAWSATVAALLAYQALHVVVLALMAAVVIARLWARRLLPECRASLDNTALLWHASALQAVLVTLVVQALPAWLS
jgi:cytochrome c oxidase subunit I+III